MTVVSLDMAYRSFLEVPAGSHSPRYAASLKPSSPRFTHTPGPQQSSAKPSICSPSTRPVPSNPPSRQLGFQPDQILTPHHKRKFRLDSLLPATAHRPDRIG